MKEGELEVESNAEVNTAVVKSRFAAVLGIGIGEVPEGVGYGTG